MISIRWKLLAAFCSIIALLITAIFLPLSSRIRSQIEDQITSEFRKTGQIFDRMQTQRFRQLRQTAVLISDQPSLKSAITTGDTATVNDKVRSEIRPIIDFDPFIPDTLIPSTYLANADSSGLLLVTDAYGKPIGQIATSGLQNVITADRNGIQAALKGRYPEKASLWEQDGRFFQVTSVPVWAGNRIIGTLSFGYPVRQIEAEQLARDIESEVAYYIDNRLVASSFRNLGSTGQEALSRKIYEAGFDLNNHTESLTDRLTLGKEEWMIYVTPIQQGIHSARIKGYFAVASSLTKARAPIRSLLHISLIVGVMAIALGLGTSLFITNRITKPVRLLIDGIERIKNGDYSREVPVITNDEMATLTETFNNLVSNLQERIQMLKFVSEATHDAIKSNLSDVQLGGQYKQVTVFFSDIRGFTNWSEKRSPQQVIEMLNTFLKFQANIVQKHGGDIDKYVGDELVAVFQGNEKERRAVNAAIEIQQNISFMLDESKNEIAVGIGINSGEVVMGAMGSEERMDYTVIGNTVNLGARLCSLAERSQILVSEHVHENLERRIPVTSLNPVSVKGIENPVPIFEVEWRGVDLMQTDAGTTGNLNMPQSERTSPDNPLKTGKE